MNFPPGCIGAGKSTTVDILARSLSEKGIKVKVHQEDVDAWCNFVFASGERVNLLQEMYEDTHELAFRDLQVFHTFFFLGVNIISIFFSSFL